MTLRFASILLLSALLFGTPALVPHAGAQSAPAPALDSALIERLTGAKGSLDAASGVFKVSIPRSDLDVRVGGVRLTPRLGLTSWAAFQRTAHGAMVMGDMVLTEPQVNPVMSMALDSGLEVTALHNHFFADQPKVMFMHIGGNGSVQDLATAVGKVFRAMEAKPPAVPRLEIDPAKTSLQAEGIERILGAKGEMKEGVLRFTFGKTTRMHGETVGAAMGVNTWAAFAGSDGQAVVDGDFAMEERELQTVLKTLRKGGIDIVAIHNHMTGEEPRIVFLHYWGVGPAARLAQVLRSALDAQASSTARHNSGDADQLLALHEEVLRAHRESNVDLLFAAEEDAYTISSAGKVSRPDLQARRRFLGPYLESTRFSVYRDQVPPIVQVSSDGSLGWVIAQIEAKGEQTVPGGTVEPLEFVSSWIELYEKRGGRWLRVGNVSNFKPDQAAGQAD